MSFDYFTKPGEILKEYLDARGITQKELALKTNHSEQQISDIINSKSKITEEFALMLEEVFEDINKKFWLDLEEGYQQFIKKSV